jgi:hypothetical protein
MQRHGVVPTRSTLNSHRRVLTILDTLNQNKQLARKWEICCQRLHTCLCAFDLDESRDRVKRSAELITDTSDAAHFASPLHHTLKAYRAILEGQHRTRNGRTARLTQNRVFVLVYRRLLSVYVPALTASPPGFADSAVHETRFGGMMLRAKEKAHAGVSVG